MAISYFSNFRKDSNYDINKYNIHKFDDNNILVTLDYGPWALLNKEEYDMLRFHRVEEDPNLFSSLMERGIIITGENFDKTSEMCKKKYDHAAEGIGLHIIAVTIRCNQKCIYCHAKSKPLDENGCDMDEKTAKAVVDFIFQTPSPNLNIEFQGGEPLVNYDIIKFIVEYAKKKNNSSHPDNRAIYNGIKRMSFNLVTNMTLMDEEKADYIIKNSIRLCTSLDGPKELHDKNRPYIGGGGSYDDVVKWIDFFKKKRNYPFFNGALPTITKFSLKYPKEIVEEYLSHGINHVRARPLNLAGNALKNWDDIGYTAEEFIQFWKTYFEFILEKNRSGIYFSDEHVKEMTTKFMIPNVFRDACFNKPCGIGTIQCAYAQNGDIYTCDEARSNDMFKLGNVNEDTYRKVFTSKEVANLIGLSSCFSTICDNCAWNAYCAPCIFNIYGSQKNLVPKLPQDFLCKVRGEQTRYIFEKLLFSRDKEIILKF